jgi:hypothetical protein
MSLACPEAALHKMQYCRGNATRLTCLVVYSSPVSCRSGRQSLTAARLITITETLDENQRNATTQRVIATCNPKLEPHALPASQALCL